MTSGCYPVYLDCISTLAQDQHTTFEGKKWEQLPYSGVVAVPRVMPKVLSLPGWYGELSDLRAQTSVSGLFT